MEKATKPLKPKKIYSEFSITRFMKEYDYPEFLFFTNKWYFTVKAKNLKQAKREFRKLYPHQKILTIKKINKT